MNLYFNDLTVTKDQSTDLELFKRFAQVFASFSKLTGEQRVWAPKWVKDYVNSWEWTTSNTTLWMWLNAAFGLVSRETPRESESVENAFVTANFKVKLSSGLQKCDQMGLSVLTKPRDARMGLSIGLNPSEEWRKLVYEIVEEREGGDVRDHLALCLVDSVQLEHEDVRDCCQRGYERELPITIIPNDEKKIHLRDDHGQDLLYEFARRIVKSCFVEEVVNSLPFRPSAVKFIESVNADGLVSIRLNNTDQGLGLVVKTTGRDLDATERIAQILYDKYGR